MDTEQYQEYALIAQTTGDLPLSRYAPHLADMGLVKLSQLDNKSFFMLGVALQAASRKINWWWVDWLVDGERRYGTAFYQLVELLGEQRPKTIMDYINLGSKDFPMGRRIWRVSVTHYREVRSLPAKAQKVLLSLAEEKKWSSSGTLRAEVKKIRKANKITPPDSEISPANPTENQGGAIEIATPTANPEIDPFSKKLEVSGDKTKVTNALAHFLQQLEKLDYAYYDLKVELVKTSDFVIDNQD